MTVSSTTNRKTFTGDAVTVAFATSPIVFFDEGDLSVYVVTTATGVAVLKTITTDYTVSGGSGATGTVTMLTAPAATETLVIVRELDLVQEVDFVNNEATDAEVAEDALDKVTMMLQQLDARIDRSLALSDSDVTGAVPTLPTPAASALIGWDSTGLALQNYSGSTLSTALTTPFTLTLLDDTTAAAARATLLIGTKSTVASAAAPDIWTGTGSLIDYTGTATATSFAAAPQAGAERRLLCAGAAVFTAGTNMLIDGQQSGASFTAAAGDVVDVIAVTTTQFRLKPRLYNSPAILAPNSVCDFRLTLTTGLPVTTADVTGAGTLYCTPFKGNRIALFDGTNWNVRTSAEFSLALTLTSGKPYDVFVYDNAGVPTLEVLVWTNDTTRATALTLQNGVLVKTGATTRRYVGTLYASGTNTTEDSLLKRYLWNYYNRAERVMRAVDTTDSWAYTTLTWRQARATATNQLDYVQGVAEDVVAAEVNVAVVNSTGGVQGGVGVGVDSTTAPSSQIATPSLISATNTPMLARYSGYPGAGRHTLVWLEISAATGTSTWAGDNGFTTAQSGITGRILA